MSTLFLSLFLFGCRFAIRPSHFRNVVVVVFSVAGFFLLSTSVFCIPNCFLAVDSVLFPLFLFFSLNVFFQPMRSPVCVTLIRSSSLIFIYSDLRIDCVSWISTVCVCVCSWSDMRSYITHGAPQLWFMFVFFFCRLLFLDFCFISLVAICAPWKTILTVILLVFVVVAVCFVGTFRSLVIAPHNAKAHGLLCSHFDFSPFWFLCCVCTRYIMSSRDVCVCAHAFFFFFLPPTSLHCCCPLALLRYSGSAFLLSN